MGAMCPVCERPVVAGDTYCEACGHPLGAPACAACGAAAVDADGYCERCGVRQPTGRDHAELVLPGGAAAVTDRGLRRARNEDAMALREAGASIVSVVCDGVGSSPRADEASAVAVETAAAALARGLPDEEAFALAGRAVTKLATSLDDAPACTYVSVVAEPGGRVRLAWAGDTRAYLLPGGELLTEDDVVPTGEITAWLGADADTAAPHMRTFTPPEHPAGARPAAGVQRRPVALSGRLRLPHVRHPGRDGARDAAPRARLRRPGQRDHCRDPP
ncbi:PP2C family protein-serine/threonine phosphatase [Nonomuraea salmonea]|uniref:PP2C family protein-serine/threonine phosphatase n=1 Tax=Nonomuraea salmonea TaxID=46181 RepID=UPI002FEDB0DE